MIKNDAVPGFPYMLMHANGHGKEPHLFVKRAGWHAGSEVPLESEARRVVVGDNASMNGR